ncbi:hypothetical protein [Palleronia sp. LCG004]|uniref:hypothetical protein n=1 Tax=Palleronia sp. LCG004 TaxID=3079304 RepID=UPI00294345CF|nr:hypothetical protein [Palleronia sp. LCG004]WOI55184.1 hypothetical protein RVY76_08940 [Palleronia sp. LCG004]
MKGKGDPNDPKGLVREAFRIDGITADQCRSILVDWALSLPDEVTPESAIRVLIDRHSDAPSDHPMHVLLREGLERRPTRSRRGPRPARPH